MSKYQLLPPLSEDEYASLFDDISAGGVKVPIDIDEHGEILDGHHRKQICDELGIECPTRVVEIPESAKADYALTVNLARRHLDRMQRRQLVINSLKLDPRLGDRVHARRCGVDHKTVTSIRGDLVAVGEIPHLNERQGADGKTYPATKPAIEDKAPPPAETPETSGLVDPSPADESGEDHPATAEPGDAAQEDVSAEGSDVSEGDEIGGGEASPKSPRPVDQPEQDVSGVSRPAPVPSRTETAEEQKAREDREMREARSLEFATGLVNVRMRLEPDPVRWYQNVYIPGLYHARNLPRVRDSFTPTGIRQAARFLNQLADHLEATGEEL